MIGAAAVALALLAGSASATPLTLCNLCAGYTISKRGDDVLVRCPGKAAPVFTFKGCRNPRVTRTGSSATIHCG